MPHPGMEYSRGMDDGQWYGGPQNYNNGGDFHRESHYPNDDYGYFEENHQYGRFRRNPSPSDREPPYSHPHYARDDLRHQLRSRSNGGPGPSFRHRGRGFGSSQSRETHNSHRPSQAPRARSRCPVKKKAQPPAPVSAASNGSNKNGSSDKDKGCSPQDAQQKNKPNAVTVVAAAPSSPPCEEPPHSSTASKEKPSASVSESEEVADPSVKPEPTRDDGIMVRRSEAIKAKAVEIEKDYRQDCETFCTVVKMLVAKEPGLDNLLHRALNENLSELKQHCLDSLRLYVAELDEVLESHGTNAESQK